MARGRRDHAGGLGLHRRLKQRFEPRGIFNPNRLIDGL
jgi:FAD/FMN-containing dehydrogenase